MDRKKRLENIVERWKKHVIVKEKAEEVSRELEEKR